MIEETTTARRRRPRSYTPDSTPAQEPPDSSPFAALSDGAFAAFVTQVLTEQGIDVPRAVREVEFQRRQADRATRARVAGLTRLASRVNKAKESWQAEQDGWHAGRVSYSLASVEAKMAEYLRLDTQFREECQNDPALIAAVRREA